MKELLYRLKRIIIKRVKSIWFKYKNDRYAIAFRNRCEIPLYKEGGENSVFHLIPNSFRYWMADPFLFKYGEENYIFAELYDKFKGKGVIGYAKIKNGRCGKFKVCLEEKFHLSYPCIYQRNGRIYMIPETRDTKQVIIFEAVDFPKKWQRSTVLLEEPCVDTTPFFCGNELFYFTTYFANSSINENLYLIKPETNQFTELISDSKFVRSGGNIIYDDSKIIRPSQDDTTYGDAVIFNQILTSDFINGQVYSEMPFRKVVAPGSSCMKKEVCVKLADNKKNIKFNGVHTYNTDDDYEVIDLRYPRLSKQ